MTIQTFIMAFSLGAALVLIVVPEDEDIPPVPRFSCEAVDVAWRQHRTGFDLEADLRILKIFRNERYTYSDLKGSCK